jgi:diphthamide biosynthesis methyltransferase
MTIRVARAPGIPGRLIEALIEVLRRDVSRKERQMLEEKFREVLEGKAEEEAVAFKPIGTP